MSIDIDRTVIVYVRINDAHIGAFEGRGKHFWGKWGGVNWVADQFPQFADNFTSYKFWFSKTNEGLTTLIYCRDLKKLTLNIGKTKCMPFSITK